MTEEGKYVPFKSSGGLICLQSRFFEMLPFVSLKFT